MDNYKLLRQELMYHIFLLDDEDSKTRGGISKMQFINRIAKKPYVPQGIEEQVMVTIGYADGYAMRCGYIPNEHGYDDLIELNQDIIRCLSGEVGLQFNQDLEEKMEAMKSEESEQSI